MRDQLASILNPQRAVERRGWIRIVSLSISKYLIRNEKKESPAAFQNAVKPPSKIYNGQSYNGLYHYKTSSAENKIGPQTMFQRGKILRTMAVHFVEVNLHKKPINRVNHFSFLYFFQLSQCSSHRLSPGWLQVSGSILLLTILVSCFELMKKLHADTVDFLFSQYTRR